MLGNIKRGLELYTFDTVLEHINEIIYKPNQLIIISTKEEQQNLEYADPCRQSRRLKLGRF